MAIRTTAGEVKAVMAAGKDYDTLDNPDLTRFIQGASLLVDRVATLATAAGTSYPSAVLRELETWLAAHGYKMSDQQAQSRSEGGGSVQFRHQAGKGLEGSTYGSYALTLDYLGFLRKATSGVHAGGAWLGKTETEQMTYDERNY